MKNPTILQLGADVLREQAALVDDFTCQEFQKLLTTLENMMLEANGIGIAAPQIGVSLQVVIVASRPTPRYPYAPEMPATIMVNPRMEITDSRLHKDWEGCLSVPGIRAMVPRHKAIKVNFQNSRGDYLELSLNDFPARVFQHEFDHLQGMVYLDRVESNRDIVAESEFFKRINQEIQEPKA